jgi:hypothetical protein
MQQKFLPVKFNKQSFVFVLEFDAAEWGPGLELAPSPTASGVEYTTIEQNRAAIPANGVRIWTNADAKRLERARTGQYFTLVDFWLSSAQQKMVAQQYPGLSYQQYLDQTVALLRAYMKKDGERVWWCLCGEQDGGVHWPTHKFKSKKEAFQYYRDCYLTNKPGRYDANRKMADYPMMKNRYRIDFKKENLAIHVSKCFSTHYPYEWGARMVWLERTGTLGNAQIGVAFLRGASRQYDGYWGMDVSSWGGCADGTCHFNKKQVQLAGISESLILREFIYYFYAGTNFILAESNAACAWIKLGKNRRQ